MTLVWCDRQNPPALGIELRRSWEMIWTAFLIGCCRNESEGWYLLGGVVSSWWHDVVWWVVRSVREELAFGHFAFAEFIVAFDFCIFHLNILFSTGYLW